MSILITICARGGSKGIPGKNIKPLNGKPLINYSIDVAQAFKEKYKDVEITLSTDSEEIKHISKLAGLETNYIRPISLASDNAGKVDAINDILKWEETQKQKRFDFVLDLDVTSPLRNLEDLTQAFEIIQNNTDAINLFSVNNANRNPYFNMVEQQENGFFKQVKPLPSHVLTRQSAPKVYDLNASFYFYKRSFFELGYKSAITDKSLIYVVPHICFDLDHPIDFEVITYLMEQNKLDFTL